MYVYVYMYIYIGLGLGVYKKPIRCGRDCKIMLKKRQHVGALTKRLYNPHI